MKRWPLALLGLVVLLGVWTSGYAAEATATPAATVATPQDDDRLPIYKQDQWQFFVSPYIWIPGMNSTITTFKSPVGTNVAWWDVASLLFSHTIGVMGRAEAWKGKWGLYLDGYYTYLGFSDSQVGATRQKNLGPVDFTLSPQVHLDGATIRLNIPGQAKGTITMSPSGAASYISRVGSMDIGGRYLVGTRPWQEGRPFPVLSMELLGGLRWNSINQFLKLNFSNIRVGTVDVDFRRFSLSAEHQFIRNGAYTLDYTLNILEPFFGTRIGIWLNPKFVLVFKGDVGGFGLVAYNNVTSNLEATLGYRINKMIYAYGGYKARGFYLSFGEGQTKVTANGWFHGPVLGATFTF